MADSTERTTLTVEKETGERFRELRWERRKTTDGLLRDLLDDEENDG